MRPAFLPVTLGLCGLAAITVWLFAPQLWPVLPALACALVGLLLLAALNPSWQCFGSVVSCGSAARPWVALTFDDGPDPQHTRAVLEALDSAGARATFFMVGEKVRLHPQLVREVHERGHQVAHHSERHDWRVMLSPVRSATDLACADATFASVLGRRPRFFRPPIGLVSPELLSAVADAGMIALLWSVRSLDGRPMPASKLVDRVLGLVGPGDIVLLHDSARPGAAEERPASARALPAILAGLAERGLQAVTVADLLDQPAYFQAGSSASMTSRPRRGILPWAVAVTFALLLGAAAASAFAAPPAPQSAEATKPEAAFPASFVWVAETLNGYSSVSARFTQRKRSQWFVDEVVQQGVLRLRSRDRRLLWSYDEGARLLLAEGKFYTLDSPQGGGRERSRRLPPMAARMAEMMESLFFLRLEVLSRHFRVVDQGGGIFVLRPLRDGPPGPFREVLLNISGEPLALHGVALTEMSGDVTRIEFSEIEMNKPLPDALLRRPGEAAAVP